MSTMGLVRKPLDMKEMNFLDATRRIGINKNMFLPKPPTRAIIHAKGVLVGRSVAKVHRPKKTIYELFDAKGLRPKKVEEQILLMYYAF